MQEILTIDLSFISTWHPKYDESERDEPEYRNLVSQVRNELNRNGSLSKETFVRILDWKSPRVKGIVQLNQFPTYKKTISDAIRVEKEQKLSVLCQLRGIGAPVGSTLLHFINPNEFPIIDVRTVETLHYAGLLKSRSTDLRQYPAFTAEMLKIASENATFSLRELDRALFAYHKLFLSRKRKWKIAATIKPRAKSLQAAREGVTTHDKVLDVFKDQIDKIFSRGAVVDLVVHAYPGTNRSSVIPSDYCYNKINADRRSFTFHGFEYTSDQKYKWLGLNYPYSGPIFWNNEQVGHWERGHCHLWKDPRQY
jgi:hypothetical protein